MLVVELDPGASEAQFDLDLSAGFTLSGKVSMDEKPLPGAEVDVSDPDHGTGRAETS